jgi:hypothetical protein
VVSHPRSPRVGQSFPDDVTTLEMFPTLLVIQASASRMAITSRL